MLADIPSKVRRAVYGTRPLVFTEIYANETNIAIWQRALSATVQQAAQHVLQAKPNLQIVSIVSPKDVSADLSQQLGLSASDALLDNIAQLVDMFCTLFDVRQTGLRLTVLKQAMCPRFHVDQIPCRLITTYQGAATQWLPHQMVNRAKLGAGNNGKPDSQSGLYASPAHIKQLACGDVALLKGELWEDNEQAGLVHRSPAVPVGTSRLLLTLDLI